MEYPSDSVFNIFNGRSDFMTGIDNEALDFAQLEAFIHGANGGSTGSSDSVTSAINHVHLPESPPDSGSEPPYSPTDLHGLASLRGSNGNIERRLNPESNDLQTDMSVAGTNLNLTTITELHVPHHIMSNSSIMYIPEEESESNNNNMHKHETLDSNDQSIGMLQNISIRSDLLDNLDHQRNYQGDLLDLGSGESNHEQMAHIVSTDPALFAHQHHTQSIITSNNKKRKLSQSSTTSGPIAIVKHEPGRNIREIPYAVVNHTDMFFCQDQLQQQQQSQPEHHVQSSNNNTRSISPAICVSTIEPGSPSSTCIGIANGQSDCASSNSIDSQSQNENSDSCSMQCIRFNSFQQSNWHILCDQSLQELPLPHYRVDADKGFNFSNSDDAFVCQKKNHFQITCHAQLQGTAVFVRTSSGLEKVRSFHLHFYGVKLEAPTQTIRVEQSQSDRSKKPFHPVPIDLQNGQVSKVTVGRLHFSETTSNNMRKKGRPNPEQRYFQLVVGLHAHTHSGHFPIISQGSERIIVRASNPGQFESDVELTWQRGATQDTIFHAGRVGINTDRPDESLVVHGNLKVSGHIVHPSDSRAKQDVSELDTSQQLINVQKIRVVRYRYEPEYAAHTGLTMNNKAGVVDTGVIAQEVQKILPEAVQDAGCLILPNGQVIENFLVVNKERIFMENIGAVKELCKVTGSLETRIEQLERINARLVRIQKLDRTRDTTSSPKYGLEDDEYDDTCSNKMIQIIICILVIIMAVCLAAISTLYFVERQSTYKSNKYHSTNNFNDFDKNLTFGLSATSGTGHTILGASHSLTTIIPVKSGLEMDQGANKLKYIASSNHDSLNNEENEADQLWESKNDVESANERIADDFLHDDIVSNSIDGSLNPDKNNTTKLLLVKPASDNSTQKSAKADKLNIVDLQNLVGINLDAFDHLSVSSPEKTINDRITTKIIGTPYQCDSMPLKVGCKSQCYDENPKYSSEIYQSSENNETSVRISVPQIISDEQQNSELHIPQTPEDHNSSDSVVDEGSECFIVTLIIRGRTLNASSSTEDKTICLSRESYYVLYKIPVSDYFEDRELELSFRSSKLSEWTQCPLTTTEELLAPDMEQEENTVQKRWNRSGFVVPLPQSGSFSTNVEFRSPLVSPIKNICKLTTKLGNFVEYKIEIFRQCGRQ